MQAQYNTDITQWQSIDDFSEKNHNFKRGQIIWLHRNRKINGFAKAFRKIGRRNYINKSLFAECILEIED